MPSLSTLAGLLPGRKARVSSIGLSGGIRRRLLDIGLREGAQLECIGRSPLGSPSAYLISDALIAIRRSDSEQILVQPLEEVTGPWD